jgi:hypothetical protein
MVTSCSSACCVVVVSCGIVVVCCGLLWSYVALAVAPRCAASAGGAGQGLGFSGNTRQ